MKRDKVSYWFLFLQFLFAKPFKRLFVSGLLWTADWDLQVGTCGNANRKCCFRPEMTFGSLEIEANLIDLTLDFFDGCNFQLNEFRFTVFSDFEIFTRKLFCSEILCQYCCATPCNIKGIFCLTYRQFPLRRCLSWPFPWRSTRRTCTKTARRTPPRRSSSPPAWSSSPPCPPLPSPSPGGTATRPWPRRCTWSKLWPRTLPSTRGWRTCPWWCRSPRAAGRTRAGRKRLF